MTTIPKKVIDRYRDSVPKFQRTLELARDRDINEADTVAIVQDILSEVFGFQKYLEITREYAVRGTFCDLAIKIEDKIQYLIEVKAVGLTLKENHLKQAVDYGANKGVQWVVLTNGIIWELYNIRFERPIASDFVASLDLLNINPRKNEDQEKLFLFSKTGLSKSVREEYYEKIQSVNRFVIGALMLSDSILSTLRRDIKRLSPGLKIDASEVEKIIRDEVLKRDVIEGEEATKARNRVRRLTSKTAKMVRGSSRKEETRQSKDDTPSSAGNLLEEG